MSLSSRSSGSPPHWLSASAVNHMKNLVEQLLQAASITAECTLRWDTEATIQKRKNLPANTFIYQPSNFMASSTVVVGVVVGKSARQDIALVSLSMPVQSADRLRQFFTDRDLRMFQPADAPASGAQPDASLPAPNDPAPVAPDSESLALFLMDLQQNAGKVFTLETLESRAARLSADSSSLVAAVLAQGLVSKEPSSSVCHLCEEAVTALLHPPAPAPAAAVPSEFERLRAAVLAARAHRDAVAQGYNQSAQQRTAHLKQLEEARSLHKSATSKISYLEESLRATRAQVETQRREILRLEEVLRSLTDASTALAVAETELRSAEAAYNQLVQL